MNERILAVVGLAALGLISDDEASDALERIIDGGE